MNQLDDKTHGARLIHPPTRWMCSPVWKFSKPHTIGIFIEALSHRHDQFHFHSFSPLSGEWVVGLKIPSF